MRVCTENKIHNDSPARTDLVYNVVQIRARLEISSLEHTVDDVHQVLVRCQQLWQQFFPKTNGNVSHSLSCTNTMRSHIDFCVERAAVVGP